MAVRPVSLTGADILSLALNLEYLEAEICPKASRNTTLGQLGIISESDTASPTTGGGMGPDFGSHRSGLIACGVSADEIQHVNSLRSSLRPVAVRKPAVNLKALGSGSSSWVEFIKLARIVEATEVSAYNGAAGFIATKACQEAAAKLLATEAEHAGAIRLLAVMYHIESPSIDASGVTAAQSSPIAADPDTGMSASRTAQQVLGIVYDGHTGGDGCSPQGIKWTRKVNDERGG